jgi:hypothetical protein
LSKMRRRIALSMSYRPDKAEKMELEVPEKARKAFRAAYRRSLNAGFNVLIVDRGKLVEVSPDLCRKEIRPVASLTKIAKGTTYKIKRLADE